MKPQNPWGSHDLIFGWDTEDDRFFWILLGYMDDCLDKILENLTCHHCFFGLTFEDTSGLGFR